MTRLIFFIHKNSGESGRMFLKFIEKRANNTKFEVCHSIKTLENKLKQYNTYLDKEIVVLFADNEERLNQLDIKKNILQDKKTIIVLPEKSQQTLSKAHKFFPRYFTFIDNKYDDLCDVLDKMLIQ